MIASFRWNKNKFPAWMELLPSLIWLFFMVLPFLVQRPSLSTLGTFDQITAICFIFVIFFLSDIIAFYQGVSIDYKLADVLSKFKLNAAKFKPVNITTILLSLFFFLSILNVWLMPEIPLVKLIFNDSLSKFEQSQLRYMATKNINAPKIILYSFNWVLLIFAPVSISALLRDSRYYFATFVFLWALIYSMITTAKLPVVAMLFILALCLSTIYYRVAFIVKWVVIASIAITGLLAIIYVSPFENKSTGGTISPVSIKNFHITDPRSYNTISDEFRSHGHVSAKKQSEHTSYLDGYGRYLINRVWLTPSDVSIRWYEYFNYVSAPIGWASVFAFTGTDFAPSRAVGKWAYVEKFPDYYNDTINAYASFDADAYARGGMAGVVWTTLIIAFFRLLLYYIRGNSVYAFPAYSVGLGLLTVLPIQASLQAIFVANGLIIVLILICVFSSCNEEGNKFKSES